MSVDVPPIAAARFPRVTTTICISKAAWRWLKAQAADAAERDGGKPSASAILENLIREAAKN